MTSDITSHYCDNFALQPRVHVYACACTYNVNGEGQDNSMKFS